MVGVDPFIDELPGVFPDFQPPSTGNAPAFVGGVSLC
jgi:hypothetical protein